MIHKCICSNHLQDKLHGSSNRVFNSTMGDKYRCSVCLHEIKLTTKTTKKGK